MFAKIKNLFLEKIISQNTTEFKNNFKIFWVGALMILSFAPFNLFLFAPLSLSIFFAIINKISDFKKVFYRGFFYCFGFFVFGIYWICNSLLIDIAKYGWLIPFAITLIPALMALYFGVCVYLYKLSIKRFSISFTYQKIIIFSLFFLVFEVVRSNLFTGFPWNLLGYIWLFDERFAQSASLVGVYGMSLFACLVSVIPMILFNFKKQNSQDKAFAIIIMILFIANFLFGFFYIDKNYKKSLPKIAKLRLVQANIQQKDKWLDEEKYQNLLKHISLTKQKSLENIDAVIWSETSIPYAVDTNNQEMMQILAPAITEDASYNSGQNSGQNSSQNDQKNIFLLSGGIRLEPYKNNNYKVWNSMFVFNRDKIIKSYDKQHLVPFGEYVPLHQYLSFLFIDDVVDKITGGGSGFAVGEGRKLINLPKFSFNPLLCYEVIFSREVVDDIDYKNPTFPDMFINLTNDSWFGNSTGPYQHLQISQMRAIEYARPLVRVAQTGITANINHYGQIIDKIDLNKEGVIDVDVYKNNQNTFYGKYGHLPLILSLIFLVIILLFCAFKKPKSIVK